jgi:hypothetical protein
MYFVIILTIEINNDNNKNDLVWLILLPLKFIIRDLFVLIPRCQVIFEIAVKLFKVLSSHRSSIKKHFEPSTVQIGGTVHKI